MRPACVCIAFLVAACIGIATASTVAVSPVDWDTRATVRWLQTLGKEYGQYHLALWRHHIDGAVLMSPHMSDLAWREVGVANRFHRKTILQAVSRLRERHMKHTTEAAFDGSPTQRSPSPPFDRLQPSAPATTGGGLPQHILGSPALGVAGVSDVSSQQHQRTVTVFLDETLPPSTADPMAIGSVAVPPSSDNVGVSPEPAGSGGATVPRGRGTAVDPVTAFPPHTLADEERWPIGSMGVGYYDYVRGVYTSRGQHFGLWRHLHGRNLTDDEAAARFLELGNPSRTGLLHAVDRAWEAMASQDFAMTLPSETRKSLHNVQVRGNPFIANKNKLVHDRDQLQYLIDHGRIPRGFQEAADNLTSVIEAKRSWEASSFFLLEREELARIGSTFQRFVYTPPDPPPALLPDALRFPLNEANDWQAIEQEYLGMDPGIVYVDNFLTPEALESVRRLCLESTTFYDVRSTYVGSYVEEGLASNVIYRIVEELRRVMPSVIGEKRLQTMWSYKYFDNQPGIKKHCDDADVNINFWVTPDEANLDPETGGLVVYKAQPPSHWTFDDFQMMPQSQINLETLLRESNAGYVRVPHRANRIVIFNSTLVHETDSFTFRTGYNNRRINFTFLFGARKWVRGPATVRTSEAA